MRRRIACLAALLAACARPSESPPSRLEKAPSPVARSAEASPAPAVREPPPPPASAEEPRWVWVLPVDNGIRADKGGAGDFLSPRAHGSHNGIDLLAPLGTAVHAPCAGKASAGHNSSHGKWVQLICPLPKALGLPPERRVSFFFAHLKEVASLGESPSEVALGAVLGSVGKTGNASASIVAPHLHFEAILQDDESRALAERHSGRDQSESEAAREVGRLLASRCLAPSGLSRKGASLWRARRVDPFVLLTCLGVEKPSYERPSGKLAEASYPWSHAYSATKLDVDSGSFRPE